MPPPTPQTVTFQVTGPVTTSAQTIYVRNEWADTWTAVPDLHCSSFSFAAAPSIGTASFHNRYGQRLKSLESAWSLVTRYAPNPRSYVKVVATPTTGMTESTTWVGIWRRATDNGLRQTFQADSIEALLAFTTVRNAFYYDVFGAVRESQVGMQFNAGGKPNRSENKQSVRTSNAYVFDSDPERSEYWSSRDIVEYLLAAHPPLKADGTAIFTCSLQDADMLPDYDRPTLPAHNHDVLSLLQAVCSRYRLLSFRTEIVEVTGPPAYTAVIVRPFTFTDTAIPLTNFINNVVGEIPANTVTLNLDFRHDPSSAASLSIAASHVADRVVVIGGWRQSVFSVSKTDETLESHWLDALETEYKDAESTIGGSLPASTEIAAREAAIKRLRSCDRYAEVFRQWRIRKLWDQKAGDGEGGAQNPVALNDDDTQYLIPDHLIEIEPELPFLAGHDYADDVIGDAAALNQIGHRGELFGGTQPYEQVPLSVYLAEPSPSTKWLELAKLGQTADVETEDIDDTFTARAKINRRWSGEARPLRGTPAFRIDIRGEQQHALALDEFVLWGGSVSGAMSWKKMIVTLTTNDPRQLSVRYPADADVAPIGEFVNEKVIEVGDEYRLIYVAPGTVVGIDETDGSLRKSNGGYLQDDRNYLMVIAQRAYEWYKVPRYALQFSTGFINGQLKIGHYVSSIYDTTNLLTVGSVITEITYDFPVAKGTHTPAPKVSYCTAFGELDPARAF